MEKITNKKVVGIGEVLWDLLPNGKKLGGAPANFAYHISQFGYEAWVVSAIGNDLEGDEILDVLDKKGLNLSIQRVNYPTGRVVVTLDTLGIPQYDICYPAAWDNIILTPEIQNLAKETQCVVFGSLAQRNSVSMETINNFLDLMPDDEQTLKIFDINLRQSFYTKEIIERSITKSNILKINDEEIVVLAKMLNFDHHNYDKIADMLLKRYNLNILALTCGANGSYIYTPHQVSFITTPKVDVVDTVGAGDSFTAALAASIMSQKTISEAHRMAVELSAYVCTQEGATPENPGLFNI